MCALARAAAAEAPPKTDVLACVCACVLALAFALAQLPPKHHLLLVELDQAGQDYHEHHQKILSKCVSRSIDRLIDRSIVDRSSSSTVTVQWFTRPNLYATRCHDPDRFVSIIDQLIGGAAASLTEVGGTDDVSNVISSLT